MNQSPSCPKLWLVIDDSKSDADSFVQAIEDLGGRAEWAANLKAGEELLRKKNFDVVLLDYIFRNSGRTGDELLPSLRRALPHLPVVMVSSSRAPDLPLKALSAGADSFLPKTQSVGLALSSQLLGAAMTATASRTLRMRREATTRRTQDICLWDKCAESIDATSRRRYERLLIIGPRGGGKTVVAMRAAKDFLERHFEDGTRPLVHIDCAALEGAVLESELLGEREQSSQKVQLSAFERALGGALVLDNIEALPPHLLRAIKHLCESMDIGRKPHEENVKLVATMGADSIENMEPGFIEAFAHREITIPSLAEFPDKVTLLDCLLSTLGIQASDEAKKLVINAMALPRWAKSIRSARRALGRAAMRSRAAGRDTIFPEDLDEKREQDAQTPFRINPNESEAHSLAMLNLFCMASDGVVRFDVAKDLLREIMITNAMVKHVGNKKKVAEVLGISRQTIYEVMGDS